MLRVSDRTRDEVMRVGREEFGSASAEETVQRLLEEHWRARAIAAVAHTRETDPEAWAGYLGEAEEFAGADDAIADGWA